MKVVVTDHRFRTLDQERATVEQAGGSLIEGRATSEAELIDLCRDADGIITARAPMTRAVIETLEKCRIITRYGIGLDTIDIGAASERGIMVANVPDYCLDEVSDHALALLMAWARRLREGIDLARQDQWRFDNFPTMRRLRGQVCGLIGLGRIGSLLAQKVRALGMEVIVSDPFVDAATVAGLGASSVSLDELLERSDYISLHAPLVESTRHMINAAALERMKPTAVIVNTSRGGLIDEAALLEALDAGRIEGAVLDVVESETKVTENRQRLVTHPRAIVTAHTAWLSEEARADLQRKAAEQVVAALTGGRPTGLANAAALGLD